MAFLSRLLRALTSLLTGIGHALSSAVGATGRGLRSVGSAASGVIPGEWKQRIALLFCTGLALVPIVYAGNMTWSFNDPSGHLDEVTAAVVDADEGATVTSVDGTTHQFQVGRDFTASLLKIDKSTVYRFVETDQATADKGLADGTYGAVVEVPRTFSADVSSLGGTDPLAATPGLLTIRTNDTVNYVSGNFTKSVGTALKESLSANVLDQYLDNVYIGFTTVHDQLVDAADGAAKLEDGATKLHDGTSQAVTGTAQLADGAGQLESGSYDLVIGLRQLSTGADTLAIGGRTLATGANSLSSGLHTLDANGSTLRAGSDQLADGSAQAAQGSRTLADGTQQLAAGTQQLDDRVSAAQARAQQLGITQGSVDQASKDLQTDVDTLADVATRVNNALTDPAQTANTLADDADTVANSVDTASTQATDLADRTSTGADQAKDVATSADTVASDAGTLKTTVDDTTTSAHDAATDAEALRGPGTERDASAPADSVQGYTSAVDDLSDSCVESGADADFCAKLQETSGNSPSLRHQAETVASDTKTVDDNLAPASQQAQTVADGSSQMKTDADGVSTLLNGDHAAGQPGLKDTTVAIAKTVIDLKTPTRTFADQTRSVADGISKAQGAAQDPAAQKEAVQKRIDALHGQASTAVQALPTVFDEAQQAASAVHTLNSGAQQVDSGAQDLATANGQIASGAGTLDQGVRQYTGGVSQAASGSDSVASGAQQVSQGADELADGANSAESGAEQLNSGATQLHSGAQQLHDGSVQLDDGAAQLQDGSTQLAEGLEDGSQKVPSYDDAQRDHLASTASNPVGLDFVRDHDLGRFGKGLAPLFLSIGLWVGGMAIFLMMPPLSQAAIRRGTGPFALLAGGLLPAQLLGLVQTAIALLIMHFWIDVTAVHTAQFVAMAALTSFVFVALNHGFGAMFGPVGKFVALVLVALQVSGAGGTYPVQTIPGFFQVIHPFLPMTHSIDAFRGTIGGGWVDPANDIAWLLGWLVLALLLGLFAAIREHRKAAHDMSGRIPADA